ncbi:hypothetical protein TWF730_007891 [Orbilia blumenaviensis]|uniref:Uncharacterized protein n=1 Tax=Orbilia blumenaviensis TaxID=1796055 RepID=A0AAV9VBL3_9PEZI
MKATFLVSIVSTLAATALAATCDASSAIDVTPYLEELSKNTGSGGGGGGSLLDYEYIYRIIDNAVKRRVKRATLDCKSSETCVALQGVPLCFDAIAYTWRDTAGDYGSLLDGSYTLSDGRKGNLYTGPYPLPDGSTASVPEATQTPNSNSNGSSSAKTETPNATTTTPSTGGTAPAVATGGSTTSAPSASQTPNGGVKVVGNMGVALAAVGGALAVLL